MHRPCDASLWVIVLLAALGAAPGKVVAQAPATDLCARIASQDFSKTPDAPAQVTRADRVKVGGSEQQACRVRGYVTPRIEFELRLPLADWNGKLLYRGCGGFCGSLAQAATCDAPVARGYACIVSDMGHTSTPIDAKWSYNDLQAEFDFAFRSTYVTTLIGKAIAGRYFERGVQRTYFDGCSTGGRQALVAAQRFPEQFDGIIVGAPAVSEAGNGIPGIWALRTLASAPSGGPSLLTAANVRQLHGLMMQRCDELDGLADGILNDPRDCRVDPSELACEADAGADCWSAAQVAAARKLYQGAQDSKGRALTPGGLQRGSELNWIPAYVAEDGALGFYGPFMADLVRYLSFAEDPGPAWTLNQFDFDRDPPRFLSLAQLFYVSYNPNLRRARDHGTKIIHYHGWNDQSIIPGTSLDYYELVAQTMGGTTATQDFYRLFMVPGMNHCEGGVGATEIDYLTALEAWVEAGKAPGSLLGTHRADGIAKFQRPVFPYPARARYLRGRDPNAASSFVIELPTG